MWKLGQINIELGYILVEDCLQLKSPEIPFYVRVFVVKFVIASLSVSCHSFDCSNLEIAILDVKKV